MYADVDNDDDPDDCDADEHDPSDILPKFDSLMPNILLVFSGGADSWCKLLCGL